MCWGALAWWCLLDWGTEGKCCKEEDEGGVDLHGGWMYGLMKMESWNEICVCCCSRSSMGWSLG